MMVMTTLGFSKNLFSGTYYYDFDNATPVRRSVQ
jgi:hypothetical protein